MASAGKVLRRSMPCIGRAYKNPICTTGLAAQAGGVFQTVVGDVLEGIEGTIRYDGAKARLARQGFEKNRRAHRLSQAVQPLAGTLSQKPIGPVMYIGGFADSVGDDRAAASAVAAGIRHQNRKAGVQQVGCVVFHSAVYRPRHGAP